MVLKKVRGIYVLILIILAAVLMFSCSKNNINDVNKSEEVLTEYNTNNDTGKSDREVILPENPDETRLIVTERHYVEMTHHDLDIVYKTAPFINGTAELKMDIYYPTTKKYDKSPLVVGFHGGGWIAGDKSQIIYIFSPIITKLRENGYTVVTAQYRYADHITYFPAQIEDCIDAILYLKNNSEKYNIDADSIGVLGYSAGAHLAMLSSYAIEEFTASGVSADIKYCVSAAGPTKMYGNEPDRYPRSTMYLFENLFQGTYPEKEEAYKKGSPYFYLDAEINAYADKTKKIPLLLIHDENDDVVPFEQSQVMFEKAKEAGIPCEFMTLRGVGHNIDFGMDYMISPSRDEAVSIILDFIYKYSGK